MRNNDYVRVKNYGDESYQLLIPGFIAYRQLLIVCGGYRSRTGDLLHAMQTL